MQHNEEYPIVPGRGLVTPGSTRDRLDFLQEMGYVTGEISESSLQPEQVSHNIESFIGTVEIPIGLAGPLQYNHEGKKELVYTGIATLEGALTASVNRGSKAITQCGGFSATVLYQRMVRCPMFIFSHPDACIIFKSWIDSHFQAIKNEAQKYSNHARLESLNPIISGQSVHVFFTYQTGDASGQNMTTTCTWHAIQWLAKEFENDTKININEYVIEGNGASDKKISAHNMQTGRGISVVATCELSDKIIQRTLRTTSEKMLQCYHESVTLTQQLGMVGYNINTSNAIAGIFAATGQDLASIHESATGILQLKKTENGLHFSLHLPNLVIGTVGGGTHLPKQGQVLELMGCKGPGKVNRFASLIAGFALALETSTFAAIVGGQFAKAHEKLGRNKPVKWLTRAEIDATLLTKSLLPDKFPEPIQQVILHDEKLCENGIIISLTNRVNRKLTGFQNILLRTNKKDTEILMKSKPTDAEVIKGLHYMASTVDPALATEIANHADFLEYHNCHIKEIAVYKALNLAEFNNIPEFYGSFEDPQREIFLLFNEWLEPKNMRVFNAENEPEKWQTDDIRNAIRTMAVFHKHFSDASKIPACVAAFEPGKAAPLYRKFADILSAEYAGTQWETGILKLYDYIAEWEEKPHVSKVPVTLVHNDLNARNAGIRESGEACFYDWELAVRHYPQRDFVEFLSFVFPENGSAEMFHDLLNLHRIEMQFTDEKEWRETADYCLKEYFVTRVSFYLTGKMVLDFKFTNRVLENTIKMLQYLQK